MSMQTDVKLKHLIAHVAILEARIRELERKIETIAPVPRTGQNTLYANKRQ